MRKKTLMMAVVLAAALVLLGHQPVAAHVERSDGYFTFFDPEGKAIFQTAMMVCIGDEFIDEENSHYRVTTIIGDDVQCTYLGPAAPPETTTEQASNWRVRLPDRMSNYVAALKEQRTVAIYHTHSDESYVPTDGSASIYGHGGIFKVGSALDKALSRLGLTVIHNTTSHDPHDAMSYTRSRRTASELMKRHPVAIFDIHRDAVPRQLYVANVKGQDVTKLTLVVGRQNPKIKANLDFAKRLKQLNDQENPGLIKGIFLAKGGYNQDLSSRALLIEVGTHENSRPAAERGISIFAPTVPKAVGVQAGRSTGLASTKHTGGGWSSVGWLLFLVVAGGAAYLYLSTGSWQELKSKLRRFAREELKEFSRRRGGSGDPSN